MTIKILREIIAVELGFKSWKRLMNSLGGDKELIDWYNDASNTRFNLLNNKSQK